MIEKEQVKTTQFWSINEDKCLNMHTVFTITVTSHPLSYSPSLVILLIEAETYLYKIYIAKFPKGYTWGQEYVNNCSVQPPKMSLYGNITGREAVYCFSDSFSTQWCACIYHDWCHIKYIVAVWQNQVRGYVLTQSNHSPTTKQHKAVVRSFTCYW